MTFDFLWDYHKKRYSNSKKKFTFANNNEIKNILLKHLKIEI